MVAFLDDPVGLSTFFPVTPHRSISIIGKDNKVALEFSDYITIGEDATDKLTITKHPVQQGAAITDHAYKEPSDLKIRILTGALKRPLAESYAILLKMQSDRIPVRVVTGKRTYNTMLLGTVDQTTDRVTENVLSISISFQEIILVQVTPSLVPKRSSQKTAAKTGATEKAGKKSALLMFKEAITKLPGLGG